jgi:integrase
LLAFATRLVWVASIVGRADRLIVLASMQAYLTAYERRGGRAVYHARRAAETHILPAFGTTPIAKLTARKIEDWHQGLAEKPALARSKPGKKPNYRRPERPMLDACRRAKINPAVSFHTLRHTHGSTLAMRGAPMAVIAEQIGHADARMTEKHYAHLAPNYVADTIRACFPRLGIAGGDNVIPIGTQR